MYLHKAGDPKRHLDHRRAPSVEVLLPAPAGYIGTPGQST